jgi:hypothetical protein
MINYLKKISVIKEIIFISGFLWAYSIYNLFSVHDFSIDIPQRLYISQATLDGSDVGERVVFFYKSVITSFFLFPLIYLIVFIIIDYLKIQLSELKSGTVVAITGFFIIVADVIGPVAVNSIHFFVVLLLVTIIYSYISNLKKSLKFLSNTTFLSGVFIISFLLHGTFTVLSKESTFYALNQGWLIFPITILITIFILAIKMKFSLFTRKFYFYAIPVAFLPVFVFVAIELSIITKLNTDVFIDFRWILLILSLSSFFLFNRITSYSQTSTKELLRKLYAPGALFSFLLLIFYLPIKVQSTDIFELANSANAVMRIFKFGEIPFVDFMSSHMLNDQYSGIIYSILAGYNSNLDFTIYDFFYYIIFYFIVWGFLMKLFSNPAMALLFIMTFPFLYILFYPSIYFGIIIFYTIINLVYKQTIINYLIFLFSLILLVLWRLDTGISSLYSSLVFLPVLFFIKKDKINYSIALKSTGIFLFAILILVISTMILRSPEYIWENFNSAFHYISANQAHGYTLITSSFNQQFYIYHVVFPFISLAFIFFIIHTLRSGRTTLNSYQGFILLSSMFFFILSLSNYQRGLVRHSFWEGSEHFLVSVFYLAISLFIFYFIIKKYSISRYIAFFAISFIVIIFLKYFPVYTYKTEFEKILTGNSIYSSIKQLEIAQGRIIPNNDFIKENYYNLNDFLNLNLTKDETFLDFSNSPMLYFYCQRKIPSYFCQSLQNTVDDYLQLQHLKKVRKEQVPVVIYSNYPPSGLDALDGVLNTMRHYLIAEFIYVNYEPFSVIDNRSIWVDKNFETEWDKIKKDELIDKPVTHDYKKAAAIISKYYDYKNNHVLKLITGFDYTEKFVTDNQVHISIPIIDDNSGIYAKIELSEPEKEEQVKVFLLNENELIGTILFNTGINEKGYMIRLSNHYLWHSKGVSQIMIELPDEMTLRKLEIYKDIR